MATGDQIHTSAVLPLNQAPPHQLDKMPTSLFIGHPEVF
jgi:hypothetical protein